MAARNEPKTSLPTNDAWTGMLAVSLLALIAGCVLLFLDWRNYGTDKPTKMQQAAPITLPQEEEAGKEAKEAPAQPAPEDKKGPPAKKG